MIYKCRSKFGGMDGPDAKRLRELEGENAKLKKLLAELRRDIYALNTNEDRPHASVGRIPPARFAKLHRQRAGDATQTSTTTQID